MTKKQRAEQLRFDREIKRLFNRLQKLYAVRKGLAGYREVPVRGYWVRKHYVPPHTMVIIDKPTKRRRKK